MTFEFAVTQSPYPSAPAISAGTQLATSGTVVFSNSNSVTFGFSGSSAVTAQFGGRALSFWQNLNNSTSKVSTALQGYTVAPMFPGHEIFPGQMTCSTFMLALNFSSSQSTSAGTYSFSIGVYTLNVSSLSIVNSVSSSFTYGAVTNNSTAFSGVRWLTLHSSQWSSQPVFTQTNYWMGVGANNAGQTQGFDYVGVPMLISNASLWGTMGVSATNSASSLALYPFCGLMVLGNVTGPIPTSITQGNLSATSGGAAGIDQKIFNFCMNNILGTW